jgi:uncharacterized protein
MATIDSSASAKDDRNVLGEELQCCCTDPMTGFYRDGVCRTGPMDAGRHTVCAVMTAEFLSYTKAMGNDLSTPIPAYDFPGLKPGDKWCLCATRWREAMEDGVAPLVDLAATHEKTLDFVAIDVLQKFSSSINNR